MLNDIYLKFMYEIKQNFQNVQLGFLRNCVPLSEFSTIENISTFIYTSELLHYPAIRLGNLTVRILLQNRAKYLLYKDYFRKMNDLMLL